MGYSVTTGYFEDLGTEYVATGAPRYMLMGAVIVYKPKDSDNKFNNHRRLMGHPSKRKLGSYFGGSVLAVDVNNDKKDDLLVGAPLYVHQTYDEGRVFVYVSKDGAGTLADWAKDSYQPLELAGDNLPGGRFGTAMASAGDLNKDGFNDVIVGAPFVDGDRGAVFVYHGNANGIDTNFKQKILASDMTGVTLKYFGQSLQGGVDLDENNYPDIAVGAPKSDTVVIFRSRPVVDIQSEIEYIGGDIDILNCIDQDYVNCTKIKVCFSVSGVSIESEIGLRFSVKLDSEKSDAASKRLEFRDASDAAATPSSIWSEEIILRKLQKQCFERMANMKETVKDYDSTIQTEVEYDLLESHTSKPLSSVRDPTIPNKKNATLNFVKSCGGNGCDYDLRVVGTVNLPTAGGENLTDGGTILVLNAATANTPVTVRVNLSNHGENAFDTMVVIDYTSLLSLNTFSVLSSSQSTEEECVVDAPNQQESTGSMRRQTLLYKYKTSIMRANTWCYFQLDLTTSGLQNNGSLAAFLVKVQASTSDSSQSSSEINPDDNSWNESRKVLYRSDFLLKKSGDSQMSFNYTELETNITSVTEIGNQTADIVAGISVSGNGYSKIPSLDATLRYPNQTTSGHTLLYLYKVECAPKDSNTKASCSCDLSVVNPLGLTLEAPNENNTDGTYVTVTPATEAIEASTFNCAEDANKLTCQTLQCTIAGLGDSDQINVRAYFRLWSANIRFNESEFKEIQLRSLFLVDSSSSPYLVDEKGNNGIVRSDEVIATAKKYEPEPPPEPVKDLLWIYLLAAFGGLLLLILLVFVLWKVGFFKSKYADMKKDAQEELANETEMPENGMDSQAGIVE